MEPDQYQVQFTDFHHRPPTGPDAQLNQRSVAAAVLPGLAYGVMAEFTPEQMGVALWAGIALFVLPALCGLIVHSVGDVVSTGHRMSRAAIIAFVVFAIYAVVNMATIHDRIHTPMTGLGPIPAVLISAAAYGVLAALVSGIAASLPVHHVGGQA